MNLPDWVYVKAFWVALSYAVAGVLSLLALFGVIPTMWALTPAALLAIFLAVLNWFDIEPQLRMRAMAKEYKKFLDEKRALMTPSKKSK